jgi:GT2 family glycosyltransferase
MLVRKDLFNNMNGFDPALAVDFNDIDFCLRVHDSGQRIAWTPYASFTHHEGASITRIRPNPHELKLFNDRWSAKYPVDPYYSPALNQDRHRIYEAL